MTNKITEHINQITEAINKVKTTIEAETYSVDPSIPLVTPELVPPIKVEIQRCAMEMGTGDFDDVF